MIGLLTAFFAVATVTMIAAVAYHFRRKPVVWLIAARERETSGHRQAAVALEAAIAAERAEGRTASIGQLEAQLREHRRAIRGVEQAREFAPRV